MRHYVRALLWLWTASVGCTFVLGCGRLGYDPLASAQDVDSGTIIDAGGIPTDANIDPATQVDADTVGTGSPTTFGETAPGPTWGIHSGDGLRISSSALPDRGAVEEIRIYLRGTGGAGSQQMAGILYSDVAGEARILLATTPTILVPGTQPEGWVSFPLSEPIVLDVGTYWIGNISGPNQVIQYAYTSVVGEGRISSAIYSEGPPTMFPSGFPSDRDMSFQAIYRP